MISIRTLRRSLPIAAFAASTILAAQTVVVPQSITATVEPFSSVTAVSNLMLNVTAATGVNTTFPYCPFSSISSGIGFISDLGEDTGSITYTFTEPVSISRMMIWNAYFDFELDHSLRNVQLVFKNASNVTLATNTLNLPIANANVLTPYVADLPEEVIGVKTVRINVNTLWGGNELSVRRLAFAGNGLTTGMADGLAVEVPAVYPVPATERVTLALPGIRTVLLMDGLGRTVPVDATLHADRAELDVAGLPTGIYPVLITTDAGTARAKVIVERAGE